MLLKELLRVIEDIKKDLAYTQRLEERWVSEQKRFPLIYKYIIKQREFFQEKIDGAFSIAIEETVLDEYVASRPGVKVQKLKTAQVSPPKEMVVEKASPAMPETPRVETSKKVVQENPENQDAFDAGDVVLDVPLVEEPVKKPDNEAVEAQKAFEEAAAAAAQKLRNQAPEPPTQTVSKKKTGKTSAPPAAQAAPQPQQQTKTTNDDKASSREKLRRLASEVLNEVKKSKDG